MTGTSLPPWRPALLALIAAAAGVDPLEHRRLRDPPDVDALLERARRRRQLEQYGAILERAATDPTVGLDGIIYGRALEPGDALDALAAVAAVAAVDALEDQPGDADQQDAGGFRRRWMNNRTPAIDAGDVPGG